MSAVPAVKITRAGIEVNEVPSGLETRLSSIESNLRVQGGLIESNGGRIGVVEGLVDGVPVTTLATQADVDASLALKADLTAVNTLTDSVNNMGSILGTAGTLATQDDLINVAVGQVYVDGDNTVKLKRDINNYMDVSEYSIYQLGVRAATPEGTLEAAEGLLANIAEMGFDVIQLQPLVRTPNRWGLSELVGEVSDTTNYNHLLDADGNVLSQSDRFVNNLIKYDADGVPLAEPNRTRLLNDEYRTVGSVYAAEDLMSIDSSYGDSRDLRRFVDKAHTLGLKVIVDQVLNHVAWTAPIITEHPEWFKWTVVSNTTTSNIYHEGITVVKTVNNPTGIPYANLSVEIKSYDDAVADGLPPVYFQNPLNAVSATNDWKDIVGINHDQNTPEHLRELMKYYASVINFWASHGCDGMRLDFPHLFNKNLLAFFGNVLKAQNKLFYYALEWNDDNLENVQDKTLNRTGVGITKGDWVFEQTLEIIVGGKATYIDRDNVYTTYQGDIVGFDSNVHLLGSSEEGVRLFVDASILMTPDKVGETPALWGWNWIRSTANTFSHGFWPNGINPSYSFDDKVFAYDLPALPPDGILLVNKSTGVKFTSVDVVVPESFSNVDSEVYTTKNVFITLISIPPSEYKALLAGALTKYIDSRNDSTTGMSYLSVLNHDKSYHAQPGKATGIGYINDANNLPFVSKFYYALPNGVPFMYMGCENYHSNKVHFMGQLHDTTHESNVYNSIDYGTYPFKKTLTQLNNLKKEENALHGFNVEPVVTHHDVDGDLNSDALLAWTRTGKDGDKITCVFNPGLEDIVIDLNTSNAFMDGTYLELFSGVVYNKAHSLTISSRDGVYLKYISSGIDSLETFLEEVFKTPLFPVDGNTLGLTGGPFNWGGSPDAVFFNTPGTSLYTLAGQEFVADGQYKFRLNSEWSFDFGLSALTGGYPTDMFETDTQSGNVKFIGTPGTYDLVIDTIERTLTLTPSTPLFEVDGNTLGLTGGPFGWGSSPDAVFVHTADTTTYTLAGQELVADGEYKFRLNSGWSVAFGLSALTGGYPTDMFEIVGEAPFDNVKFIGTPGTYDLVVDTMRETLTVTLVA